jgi:hypothetical protein
MRHRDDVKRRPVEDYISALMRQIDLDAETIDLGEPRIGEGQSCWISLRSVHQTSFVAEYLDNRPAALTKANGIFTAEGQSIGCWKPARLTTRSARTRSGTALAADPRPMSRRQSRSMDRSF